MARAARDLAIALAALATTTAVLSEVVGTRNPTTVALALLLVVLGAATLSRMAVAIATAVCAMLTLNFVFLPPVGTFRIADPQNWVALLVFLAVATIASQLSSTAQERAREAVARRQEVSRLFDLSRDILLTTETASALPTLARHIARRFDLESVAICVPEDSGSGIHWSIHQGGEREVVPLSSDLDHVFARLRGTLEYDARQRTYGGQARVADTEGQPTTVVPLRLGTRPIALLATSDETLDPGTLDALGGVAAIAIERLHFLREREAAAVLKERADLTATLLASLSHDLRTPLTAARMAVSNLQEPALAESDRRAQAQLALAEIDRLNRLFQDILDMARIDAAAIAAEREWVTPSDIVDAAIARVGLLLETRPLRIDADSDAPAEVDPKLTSSALAHLIENAAQYSPAGSEIEIRGWTSREGLHLRVRDRGSGLDAAELDHLFDRFYRGSSARRHSFGTGMGLAITRGLLAAESGRVWGENAEGGGASFTMVVPARVRQAARAR